MGSEEVVVQEEWAKAPRVEELEAAASKLMEVDEERSTRWGLDHQPIQQQEKQWMQIR